MDNLFFKEEHKMIQNMICDFAKDEILPIAKELDKNGSFPRKIVKKMGQLGLMGINVPSKYGGYGYVHEYDVDRFFRDEKILEIIDGKSEIQRLTISKEIIKDKMAC